MRPTVLFSLLLLAAPAHAQNLALPVEVQPPPRRIVLVDSGRYMDAARKLQVRGAFFMGAGIVHLVGSAIATGFEIDGENFLRNCRRTGDRCYGDWGITLAAASTTFALGTIFTIVGIPMYIEGTTRLHKMKVRAELDAGGLKMTF